MVSKWGEIPPMTVEQIWRKLGLTDATDQEKERGLRDYINHEKLVKPPLRESLRNRGYGHLIPGARPPEPEPQIDAIKPV